MSTPWMNKRTRTPIAAYDENGKFLHPIMCDTCPCDGLYPISVLGLNFLKSYIGSIEPNVSGGTMHNTLWVPMTPEFSDGTPRGWQPAKFLPDGSWQSGYWEETSLSQFCDCSSIYNIGWWGIENLQLEKMQFTQPSWFLKCMGPEPLPDREYCTLDRDFGIVTEFGSVISSSGSAGTVKYIIKDRYGEMIGYRTFTFDSVSVRGTWPIDCSKPSSFPEFGKYGNLNVSGELMEDNCMVCAALLTEEVEGSGIFRSSEVVQNVYDKDDNLIISWNHGLYSVPQIYSGPCEMAIIIGTQPITITNPAKKCIYTYESEYIECAWTKPKKIGTVCGYPENYSTEWEYVESTCKARISIITDSCRGANKCEFAAAPIFDDPPELDPPEGCSLCVNPEAGSWYVIDVYIYDRTGSSSVDCGGGEHPCGGNQLGNFYKATPIPVNGCYEGFPSCGDGHYNYYEGRCDAQGLGGNIVAGPFDETYCKCLADCLNKQLKLCACPQEFCS